MTPVPIQYHNNNNGSDFQDATKYADSAPRELWGKCSRRGHWTGLLFEWLGLGFPHTNIIILSNNDADHIL